VRHPEGEGDTLKEIAERRVKERRRSVNNDMHHGRRSSALSLAGKENGAGALTWVFSERYRRASGVA
jgi:hypothetical protein